jgi:uncharacterized membrane protein YfcA
METIALPLIGFMIGLLIVSLGGGGGGIYVGVLTAFFNVPPAIAAATSLATIIPTTTMGTFSHWKAGNVNVRLGLVMMSGAVAGAVVGSACSDFVPRQLYTKLTGGLLLLLAVQMIYSYRQNGKTKVKPVRNERKQGGGRGTAEEGLAVQEGMPEGGPDIRKARRDTVKAVAYGFLGGAMSGLVGVSGTTPIVAGLVVLGCSALETVGTSVFVLVGISVTGFFMHLGLGNVEWRLVGLLVIGTMSGAFLGPMFLRQFNRAKLEKVLPPLIIVLTIASGGIVLMK